MALFLTAEPELLERTDWRDGAACRDTSPDLFFPVGTTGPALEQIDQATGLGLMIVRTLMVSELAGTITVEPAEGPSGRGGTIVRLTVPVPTEPA